MHYVLVGDVAVGEDSLVDIVILNQLLEVVLGVDRDTVGVQIAAQLGRIRAAVDVGNLRSGERDDFVALIVAEVDVEVVKIATGSTQNQYA